ncbi:hypothetical protein L6259_02545 [Candidatus Parcubacteria bacterium]|nr:hypothetical protein [Patescibacteria group bacterium]MCG2694125.1 hypothetical protein [Candidatus Parcubacteria bacterium]
MENPKFLKEKFGLHSSPEAEQAVKRTEARTGEKVPQTPEARIQNYLNRFREILDRPEGPDRERGVEAIKIMMHRLHVIKPKDIPESYFENQRRLARELGHGDIEITPQAREQLTEVIITDQKSTMDNWTDYLTSKDADAYPDWAKYWAFRSMLKLGKNDKEKHKFEKRRKDTVSPFPDLNREALAYVVDIIIKKADKEDILSAKDNPELEKIIKSENFAKLYAWAIEKVTPTEESELLNTKGEWKKYDKNSNHMPLVESLQGHGTGWCTAGESTAEAQLKGGDFYVYYSYDKDNNPTIPRAAIRMEGDSIGEVRGIGKEQNLDPYISDIVKKKVHEFSDGEQYEKKAEDMKTLTAIDNKTKLNQSLSKDELIFLYEIESPIQGFGYRTDPRIEEIRKTRNLREDAPIVFECESNQIAYNKEQINEQTKAYIGKLYPNIFQELQHLEYIYTSFPEGKIKRQEIEIGGKTKDELIEEMQKKNINISNYAKSMMENPDFTTSKTREKADIVRLKVADLGFTNFVTTDELYKRAEELGLELCLPETGPQYRLQYADQPLGEWIHIGMKQIADSDGNPDVFNVERNDDGLWLYNDWAKPTYKWNPDYEIVFRLRKLET